MDSSTKDRPKTIHNTTTPIVLTTKLVSRQGIDYDARRSGWLPPL